MSRRSLALALLLAAGLAAGVFGAGQGGCGGRPSLTPIGSVQGRGDASSMQGRTVTVEGVVIADLQRGDGDAFDTDLGGFFVQEARGDGDPRTSDGLYVYGAAQDVSVGDLVRVTGRVTEYEGITQLSGRPQVVVCRGGAALPAAAPLTLPVAGDEELEALEGMLVTFPQELYVADHADFDRYGEVVLSAAVDGGRPYQPTSLYDPGDPRVARTLDLVARSRIVLDDGRTRQNPEPVRHPAGGTFTLADRFRAGDVLTGVTGVLDHAFGSYRVHPTQPATHVRANPPPQDPPEVGGSLRVASFNVLNYFDGFGSTCGPSGRAECRGADGRSELERQAAKLVAALAALDADVLGLVELENDRDQSALRDLVRRLNEATGGAYAYVDAGAPIGRDVIRVALVYRRTAVTPVGAPAVLDDRAFVDPQGTGSDRNRPALAQTFQDASGGRFTVVVNHLKSKGSSCGRGDDDPVQGDCNGTRAAAAKALLAWLATDPTGARDPDVLVIGDLNSYAREDPVAAFLAAGYVDLLREHEGEGAYTYLSDGMVGYLDHALASPSLAAQVTGAAAWHVNADEPDIIDYDTTFKGPAQEALYAPDPFRSSDHDPVLVGLALSRDR